MANLQAGNFIRGYTEFWNITFERQLGLGWTGGGPFLPLKHERVGTMTYDFVLKVGEYFTGQCRAALGEVEEAVGEQGDGDDTSRGARAGK
ncbi:MAG: hypothetical protein M3O31_10855 [Acidobacteriota bacterium]|nr:hypothetical protein [Acidobacteriota bacterium]